MHHTKQQLGCHASGVILMHARPRAMPQAQHVSSEGTLFQELLTWGSPPVADQHCQCPTAALAAALDLQPHQLPE